jgi:hypothetical protein
MATSLKSVILNSQDFTRCLHLPKAYERIQVFDSDCHLDEFLSPNVKAVLQNESSNEIEHMDGEELSELSRLKKIVA